MARSMKTKIVAALAAAGVVVVKTKCADEDSDASIDVGDKISIQLPTFGGHPNVNAWVDGQTMAHDPARKDIALLVQDVLNRKMALRACAQFNAIGHDSFTPTDAVRSLPEYDAMSGEQREVVDFYTRQLLGVEPAKLPKALRAAYALEA